MRVAGGAAEPTASGAGPVGPGYESKFGNWDRRASVRTQPRRVLADGSIVDGDGPAVLFFPPELVPAAGHPLVTGRGGEAVHRLLVQSLYQYLHFTEVLEQVAVMPVTMSISLGRSGVQVPAAMRADALAITTDEAWHAQFSYDFADQVRAASGVAGHPPVQPQFVGRLARIRRSVPPEARRLVDLFFAVVSETLISTILSDIPRDQRLPPALRALVADHAADEGRHHAYFRSFLRVLWGQLDPRERRLVGPRVPELVEAFLEPDVTAVARTLRADGLPAAQVRRVVAESYPPARAGGHLAVAAAATARCFQDLGALDDPATAEAFAARGLVASCSSGV
jgi:hypothetical protein